MTHAQIVTQIETDLPDNVVRRITPMALREVLKKLVDYAETTAAGADTDDQTAQQVPMTAIAADAAHVAVNTTDVQAGLFELAGHAKTNAVATANLANTQRAWAKVGSSQATNGGAVLVGDDVYHAGNAKIEIGRAHV